MLKVYVVSHNYLKLDANTDMRALILSYFD